MLPEDCTGLTVLALSPHPDDAELGAGGTLAKLVSRGATVYIVAFSLCEKYLRPPFDGTALSREADQSGEALATAGGVVSVQVRDYAVDEFPFRRQDICLDLWNLNSAICPDIVFAPCSWDIHQDHQVVSQEATRIFKRTTLLGYHLPWNCLRFEPQLVVRLSDADVETKLRCLACYKSQGHRDYMKPKNVIARLRTDGQLIQTEYAEAFQVIRDVWR